MSERYCTNFRIIYDNDKKMTLEEVTERLNEQQDEIESLKLELSTHKHPLWSTREAERVVNEQKEEIERLREELRLALN